MGWLLVLFAAAGEVLGAAGLKLYSQQKTFKNGLLYIGGFGASFAFLYTSFHFVQLSIAYIVWVGIGTAGAVLISMYLFREPKNIGRMISVGLIILGVIGLKVFA